MNSFNTSVTKDHYSITFETDDKNNYEEVERLCRRIIDNPARTIPVTWVMDWVLKYETDCGPLGISRVSATREDVNRMLNDWWKENETN